MSVKQPIQSMIDHANFKLDKMVDEIKQSKSTIDSLLKKFVQTQFKSDEQYVEKKERLTNFVQNELLNAIRKGRGFIKKKFDSVVRELRHIHDDQIGLTNPSESEYSNEFERSYDVMTQADIEIENTAREAFKFEFSDDEDFDDLLDLSNRKLFGVKKLFQFSKAPTDLDYVVSSGDFVIVSDNKVMKISKAEPNKSVEDQIRNFSDFKDLKTMANKKWDTRLVYVPSKFFQFFRIFLIFRIFQNFSKK